MVERLPSKQHTRVRFPSPALFGRMTPTFLLKLSRPGLWFSTIWVYLLPTSRMPEVWGSLPFWVGLAYVSFPLNFLIYGWNDISDYEIDQINNVRKDNFWFGARATRAQLDALPPYLVASQVPFAIALVWIAGWTAGLFLLGLVVSTALYNFPKRPWSGRAPLELLNQFGFLVLLPLSMQINHTPPVSAAAMIYLALFWLHSHMIGEVLDMEPDRQAGRKTTALLIGMSASKWLIIVTVLIEALLLFFYFRDWYLGAFLIAADVLVFFVDRTYSKRDFTLIGIGMNLSGFASMAWVWETGTLMPPS